MKKQKEHKIDYDVLADCMLNGLQPLEIDRLDDITEVSESKYCFVRRSDYSYAGGNVCAVGSLIHILCGSIKIAEQLMEMHYVPLDVPEFWSKLSELLWLPKQLLYGINHAHSAYGWPAERIAQAIRDHETSEDYARIMEWGLQHP
jgi:hypothetical protein